MAVDECRPRIQRFWHGDESSINISQAHRKPVFFLNLRRYHFLLREGGQTYEVLDPVVDGIEGLRLSKFEANNSFD